MSLLKASAVCLLLPMSAGAGQLSNSETCVIVADLAELIMTLRQKDAPMSELWSRASGDAFIRELILSAYELPAYSTEGNQQRAVKQFRNGIELECYKKNWVMEE